jgi:NAD dependent epimerase/dehydratase family enzyme
MRTAIIAGATGLVGSSLLNQLVESKNYNKIKILVRKPIELNLPGC